MISIYTCIYYVHVHACMFLNSLYIFLPKKTYILYFIIVHLCIQMNNNKAHNNIYRVTSLDMLPDTFCQPIVGPALTIRGHLLKWEGAPSPDLENNSEPVDLRVTFESGVEEEITSHLAMENSGTTAIYFSWQV